MMRSALHIARPGRAAFFARLVPGITICLCTIIPAFSMRAQTFWEPAGLADTSLTTLSINSKGDILTASSPSNLLHFSPDEGSTWTTFAIRGIIPSLTALDDSGIVYAADPDAFGNGLQRTKDRGTSWTTLSDSTMIGCYSLGVRPSGEVFATFAELLPPGTNYIYHSLTHGDGWMKDSVGFGVALLFNLSSQSLFAFNPSGDVFVIGTDGIHRSADHSATWEKTVNGLAGTEVKTLCINSKGDLFVQGDFVGKVGYLYRSTDNGDSWSKVAATGLPPFTDFTQLTTDEHDNLLGVVIRTNADGIYRSTDSGSTWTNVTAGLLPTFGTPTLFHQPGGLMYCATHDGLYQGTSSVSSVGGGNGNPVGWKLEQNYPNPFNPSTTITYELPRAFQVTLTVFDILGREVSVLVNERREAGVYEVKLDASELASGVYLYRLTAGSFVQTKKMLVVK